MPVQPRVGVTLQEPETAPVPVVLPGVMDWIVMPVGTSVHSTPVAGVSPLFVMVTM